MKCLRLVISLGAYDPDAASAGGETVPEYYVGTYTAEFTQAIADLKARNEAGEDSPGGPYAIAFEGWPFTQSAEQLAQLQKMRMGMVSTVRKLAVEVLRPGLSSVVTLVFHLKQAITFKKQGMLVISCRK